MLVEAIEEGFFGGCFADPVTGVSRSYARRIEKGQQFHLTDPKEFSNRWMIPLDDEARAAAQARSDFEITRDAQKRAAQLAKEAADRTATALGLARMDPVFNGPSPMPVQAEIPGTSKNKPK